jgi:ABC-type oligopeptide transport system substrate-binding subunit
LLLVLVAGVALLVSAAFADPDGESRRGGTLRLMWGAEPELDPALAAGSLGSWMLLNATCAKLFTTVSVPKTGRTRVVPELVRSYEISGDGRTYTFELERTFRFDNREKVTARSFADAFNRTASPAMSSPAWRRGFFKEIIGADAFRAGKSASISGVQVLGLYRLRIRLDRRAGDFLARLTMPFFCPILPKTPISAAGIDDPPGSGPYHIADRVRERRMVLERNPYYGGDRTANPDRIVWTIEPDFAERIRATERNEQDFTPVFGYSDAVVRDLEERYGINRGQFHRMPSLSNFMFAFNTKWSPAFKGAGTAPLRKAINYVLDRPALNSAHGYLTGRRTDRLLPAALSESRRFYPIGGPDPIAARRWLAEAPQRPKTLTLYTASFSFSVANALVFRSNLRQLDIDVDVKVFSFPTLLEKVVTKGEPWDVVWLPWGAFYPGPAGFLLPLLNDTRYEPRIEKANRLTGEARAKSWAKLEADLMRNDPPAAVYADSMALVLTSRNFGCFPWVPGADLELGAVCLK